MLLFSFCSFLPILVGSFEILPDLSLGYPDWVIKRTMQNFCNLHRFRDLQNKFNIMDKRVDIENNENLRNKIIDEIRLIKVAMRHSIQHLLHPLLEVEEWAQFSRFMILAPWIYNEFHLSYIPFFLKDENRIFNSTFYYNRLIGNVIGSEIKLYLAKVRNLPQHFNEFSNNIRLSRNNFFQSLNQELQSNEKLNISHLPFVYILMENQGHFWVVLVDMLRQKLIMLEPHKTATYQVRDIIAKFSLEIIYMIHQRFQGIYSNHIGRNLSKWNYMSPIQSIQTNGYDCGYYIFLNIFYTSQGVLPRLVDEDMTQMKLWLGQQLVTKTNFPIIDQ
ncbi:hypothetical protein SNEBB_004645 [Seison nebaliae]|nr:hypothetical protein SNEBB_004645 [Seison nebaliae]